MKSRNLAWKLSIIIIIILHISEAQEFQIKAISSFQYQCIISYSNVDPWIPLLQFPGVYDIEPYFSEEHNPGFIDIFYFFISLICFV